MTTMANTAWGEAQDLYRDLMSGRVLRPCPILTGQTPPFVLNRLDSDEFVVELLQRSEGSALHLDRFRPSEWVPIVTSQTSVVVGSQAMVAGYLVGSMVRQQLDHHHVRRATAPRWQPTGIVDLIVTNKRVWYWASDGVWHWLRYSTMTAVTPDLPNWTLTLQFQDTYPARFVGAWAPWLAVAVCSFVHGPGPATVLPSLAHLGAVARVAS